MNRPVDGDDAFVDYCTVDTHVGTATGAPAPFSLTLYDRSGIRTAGIWFPPDTPDTDRMRKVVMTLAPMCESGRKQLVVSDLRDFNDFPIYDLIPNDFGQESDTVKRLRMLLRDFKSRAMEEFLDDVFCLRTVFHSFWTCPVSQKHHHAYRGGLAAHSIEVAEWVANSEHLSDEERDIGIAYSLLHDIGKFWRHGKNAFADLQDIGHDLTGPSHISRQLERLHVAWPDAGISLRSLLSGRWMFDRSRSILAVGNRVNSLDQASAEKDLRMHKAPGHSLWPPKPPVGGVSVTRIR